MICIIAERMKREMGKGDLAVTSKGGMHQMTIAMFGI